MNDQTKQMTRRKALATGAEMIGAVTALSVGANAALRQPLRVFAASNSDGYHTESCVPISCIDPDRERQQN